MGVLSPIDLGMRSDGATNKACGASNELCCKPARPRGLPKDSG